jgi:biopolymer transport protein ExbB
MHRLPLLLLGFLALAPAGSLTVAVQAQTLEHMAAGVHQDLSEALAELSALREQIDAERLPMARQLTALEDEVLSRRRDYDRAQRQADNRLVALGELRREVEKARVDARFLSALLTEYVTRFETRIHVCEVPRYKTEIATAKTGATQTDLAPAERLQKQLTLLDVASARLDGLIGGDRFAGRALTPAGRLESGQFALVGPLAFFASAESPNAGVAELRLGSAQPRSLELGARPGIAIRALAGTGSGVVPIDATLGNALKIAEKRDSLVAHVMKGGPVMIPILLLGLVAVAICIAKWFQLARIRVVTPMELQTVLSHLRHGEKTAAEAHAESLNGPVGQLLGVAVRHAREQKEYLEEVLYEKMLEAKPALERLLPIIALTAACAPLLGLLGTVTGMINTFNMITLFGAGDPRTLSGGISEALITTEFGLIVAIPALLLHAFLSRKVKGVLGSMEQTSVAFINGVAEPED